MTQRPDFPKLPRARSYIAGYAVIAANRQNAQRSTGPRTPAGKAKAARNSWRHGLSRPVLADPVLAREVEARAHRIAGAGASHALAMRVAEAEVDLARIARVRQQLTARLAAGGGAARQLARIERYERRARFRLELALAELDAAAPTPGDAGVLAEGPKQNEAARNEADWQNKAEQNEAAQNEADWRNKAKQNEPDWRGSSEHREESWGRLPQQP
jgi:hypothetical protein